MPVTIIHNQNGATPTPVIRACTEAMYADSISHRHTLYNTFYCTTLNNVAKYMDEGSCLVDSPSVAASSSVALHHHHRTDRKP